MKKTLSILLVTAVTMFGMNSFAQNQGNPGCCPGQGTEMHKEGPCAIPNLTDEQVKKIEPLKTDFQKKKFEIHNQIKVKQAQLIVASTGDKINKDEAYRIIDEIAALKASMEKAKFDHQMAVRAILTPEQQLAFDMHHAKGGEGCGHSKGNNCGPQGGQGCGQGQMKGACGQGQMKGACGGQGQMQGGACCPDGQKQGAGCSGQGKQPGTGNCPHGK